VPLRWAGNDIAGNPVKPGIYFYKVVVGGREYTGQVLKIK